MCLNKQLAASLFLLLALPSQILADSAVNSWDKVASITYFDICDGSAAVRIDDRTLLVANDV